MTIINNIGYSKPICNLDTYQHTALATQPYSVNVTMSEVPPSGLSITIQRNGSTVASAQMNSNQNRAMIQAVIPCVVADVISIIVASSAVQESAPNSIKGLLNLHIGSSQ